MTEEPGTEWHRAMRALSALMVDPGGLGGMVLRARVGPVRQRFEQALGRLPLPQHRIHPGLDDTSLFGGLNVASSLSVGHLVRHTGLAEQPAALILPMAERTPPDLAARLSQVLDRKQGHALILLDEGAEPEETAPPPLVERLAFYADLSSLRAGDLPMSLPAPADLDAARAGLASVHVDPEMMTRLVVLAMQFGIHSLRAPLLALRCARALAALDRATCVRQEHLQSAAELVFPSRALTLPDQSDEEDSDPPDAADPEPPIEEDTPTGQDSDSPRDLPDEMLIANVTACLPPDVLARLANRAAAPRAAAANSSGAGNRRIGNRRGRPLPSRPGRADGRSRIDLIATLRAAAPWQMLRRAADPGARKLIILPGDIRLKRFEDHSDRLVIFGVDASGSAALARMGEAKGAVELLLAQAYAKRDQVALVAFRGDSAEVLLPPTRSLVQAKRRLSALPGGGGTPLAAGLRAMFDLSIAGRRAGMSPCLAILTDGRGNIAFDGTADRAQARLDTQTESQRLSTQRLPAVVIDTAARPGPDSAALATWLSAQYLPLPRADARRISVAADAALGG